MADALPDLSAMSLADLPGIDGAVLDATVDRLMPPCGGGRVWQNYATQH